MTKQEAQKEAQKIVRELQPLRSEENLAGMARYGIDTSNALGIPLSVLKPLAKEIGRQHELALALWDTQVREARVVAFLIADPRMLTKAQATKWARESGSWDICDGCVIHLFRKSPDAWELAWKWAPQKQEFIRRAGFAMFSTLAVHDKKAPDETFLKVLPLIEQTAGDGRNFVKKAVNWALRQIGKRNPALRKEATAVARRLAESESTAARWVAKDALREFAKQS